MAGSLTSIHWHRLCLNACDGGHLSSGCLRHGLEPADNGSRYLILLQSTLEDALRLFCGLSLWQAAVLISDSWRPLQFQK